MAKAKKFFILKDFQATANLLTDAINLNPNFTEAYYNRGLAYANLQNYEQALADFSKAVELNPSLAEAYYYRGNIYNDFLEPV